MKKVLIISYYWPPAGGPGSQRVVKFVKYLPKFGWQPVVLTVKNGEFPYLDTSLEEDIPPDIKVYRTKSWEPFRLFKKMTGRKPGESLPVGYISGNAESWKEKLAKGIRTNIFIPDGRIGWIPFAVRAAKKILREEDIRHIFTSSPPHSIQLIGLILKRKYHVSWLADLRDPWTDIRYYQFVKRWPVSQNIDSCFEKKTLNRANRLTTVSTELANDFMEKVKTKETNKITVIPNGYDESDFRNLTQEEKSHFFITHTGNMLYNQNPVVLWQAVQQLITEIPSISPHLKIRLIGRVHPEIIRAVKNAGLGDILEVKDFIPHREVLQEMKDASILLLVVPDVEKNEGIVTGKLFEYIGSGRPILALGPAQGDAGKIVTQISNSVICDYKDTDTCKKFLKTMVNHWQNDHIPESADAERKLFTRENLTKRLADIFRNLLEEETK